MSRWRVHLPVGRHIRPQSGVQTAVAAATPASPDELAEVTVTGIRASLQKSLDIKENPVGVVRDAISAEDIGQLPPTPTWPTP